MCSSKNCDAQDLLFYPKFETESLYKDNLKVTWFESSFSQSHYKSSSSNGSNACTIIAILVASKCNQQKLQISEETYNLELLYILGHCMLDGNKLHKALKAKEVLCNINLTVPEAIKYTGKRTAGLAEWKSLLYLEPLGTTLYENLSDNLSTWSNSCYAKHHPDLYVILIADSRSVLFILQNNTNTITLVDSHQHSCSKGAFIAFTKIPKMKLLCNWFSDVMCKYYNSNPDLYELSFLYFHRKKKESILVTHTRTDGSAY